MIALPAVIGHRGAAGASWVEFDVPPLVVHDEALERTARLDQRIDEMTKAAVREFCPVETLPSLAAAPDWLANPKLGVNVEIKPQRWPLPGGAVVSSFDPRIVATAAFIGIGRGDY